MSSLFSENFQKQFCCVYGGYQDTDKNRVPGSSTGMLQVNKDIGILGPLFGFQNKNLPQKPEPYFHGDTEIRGIRRIRESPRKTRHIFSQEYEDTGIPDPLQGVQDENQSLGRPSSLKIMGIRGYEGYEGYELLPEKPDTFFHGDTGIRGIRRIRELSQKNQTHF